MPHDMQAWQQFEQDTGLPRCDRCCRLPLAASGCTGAQGTLLLAWHTTKACRRARAGWWFRPRRLGSTGALSSATFAINLHPAADVPVGTLADMVSNAKMSEYHAAMVFIRYKNGQLMRLKDTLLQVDLMQKLNQASGHRLSLAGYRPGRCANGPRLLCARLPSAAARNALEQACQQARITTKRCSYQPLLQHMPREQ